MRQTANIDHGSALSAIMTRSEKKSTYQQDKIGKMIMKICYKGNLIEIGEQLSRTLIQIHQLRPGQPDCPNVKELFTSSASPSSKQKYLAC